MILLFKERIRHIYFTTLISSMPYFISKFCSFSSIISPGEARAMHGGQGITRLAAVLLQASFVFMSTLSAKVASLMLKALCGIWERRSSGAAQPFPAVSSINFATFAKSSYVLNGEAMSTAHSELTYSGSILCLRKAMPNSSAVIPEEVTERVRRAGSTFRVFGARPCSKAW